MASFDYKREYKEFYMPPKTPNIIMVPPMNFISVRGKGDPNQEGGAYKSAIGLLYSVAFTIKMSKKNGLNLDGYFDYVVPPLEGLWWMDDSNAVDYSRKEDFCWISLIRLPEFVTKDIFDWAVSEASAKKGMDLSSVEYFTYEDGLCVQCMHTGPYDNEPATIEMMERYAIKQGYAIDHSGNRRHHEIYLSDARRCKPENLKTVIRQPIRRLQNIV